MFLCVGAYAKHMGVEARGRCPHHLVLPLWGRVPPWIWGSCFFFESQASSQQALIILPPRPLGYRHARDLACLLCECWIPNSVLITVQQSLNHWASSPVARFSLQNGEMAQPLRVLSFVLNLIYLWWVFCVHIWCMPGEGIRSHYRSDPISPAHESLINLQHTYSHTYSQFLSR